MSMRPARELMTEHAQRSEALKRALEAAGRTVFAIQRVEVTRPEQSTGGGLRSLQRIRVVPPSGPAIVIGEANLHERRAELRTLGHVQTIHNRRFGQDAAIDPDEYLRFSDLATKVLSEFGVTVVVSALPKSDRDPAVEAGPDSRGGGGSWPWWVAPVVLAIGAALVWAWRMYR